MNDQAASAAGDASADSLLRKSKMSYAFALILIGALATASFFLLSSVISANLQKSALIELSTRQQMLTQRILLSATEAYTADMQWTRRQARAGLKAALKDFLGTYALLRNGSTERHSPLFGLQLSEAAVRLFEDRPSQIDASTMTLAGTVEAFLWALPETIGDDMPAKAADQFTALKLHVAEKARRGYHDLTMLLSTEASAEQAAVEKIHLSVFALTLLLLLVEAALIFRPLTRKLAACTSELVKARDQMAFAANHDALTGLYNRAFLNDYLETALAAARRKDEMVAMVHLDLDRFKTINDTLGHGAGDAVLLETARRLQGTVRESDVCVRLGGDEFVVILNDVGNVSNTIEVVSRITERLKEPFSFGGALLQPSASVGVAFFPDNTTSPRELIANADLALYRAKAEGRGTYRLFASALRDRLEEDTRLETKLREAIATDDFSVHFQPQVALQTGKVIGVEALIRWTVDGKNVAPGVFLPVAVKSGLMPAIGRIVFAKAIKSAAAWHRTGVKFGRLSLNASAEELRQPDFASHLLNVLRREGLPVELVALEIVESVVLDDDASNIPPTLNHLRDAGVRLELDDFGTGYACLAHVGADNVDRLKIDARFVRNIHANPDNAKIVKAIIDLARELGISIVAEGAETEQELSCLLKLGCPGVQGYGVAFPMPDDQTSEWLSLRSPAVEPAWSSPREREALQ
ncbi:MAG TPA: EAL domain-containing protein [Rhizobiaceae bacterium]|nr:EAL domain-containing protein [Rhizobiaceae bacterium]